MPAKRTLYFRKPTQRKESKLRETLNYLRGLDGDVSCARVWGKMAPAAACTDPPVVARLESRLIDVWAQTTYRDRFVPPVASGMHGKQESQEPDAEVAWRSDVTVLAQWQIGAEQMRRVLEYYPVQVREKLAEPASRIAAKLGDIAERIGAAKASNTKLILVESDGTPSVCDLAYLAKQNQDFLAYKLLLLPDGLGSAPAGMFQPAPSDDSPETFDVADPIRTGEPFPSRIRFLFHERERANRLPTKDDPGELPAPDSTKPFDLARYASDRYRLPLVIENPADEDSSLVYYGALSAKRDKLVDVGLSVHQASVAARAKALVASVGLPDLESIYERVGATHDSGKQRPVWQRAMGGTMENPLAKSKAPVNVRLIDGYRHELGSLLHVVSQSGGTVDDLLLHLVASHHAAARPFFETRQYDRENLRLSSSGKHRSSASLRAIAGAIWGMGPCLSGSVVQVRGRYGVGGGRGASECLRTVCRFAWIHSIPASFSHAADCSSF